MVWNLEQIYVYNRNGRLNGDFGGHLYSAAELFSPRSESLLRYGVPSTNASHSAAVKLSDLQLLLKSLLHCALLKEPLGGSLLDKVSLHCQHFKKSKPPRPILFENALMFSISQRVVDFWLFSHTHTHTHTQRKKNPFAEVSCSMFEPAELLTCAPAFSFHS